MIQMDSHPTVTLTLAIWAGVGPMAGIVIGHFMSRSIERERWLRDARKEEYRELLSELGNLLVALTKVSPGFYQYVEAQADAIRVLKDRLYIAPELREHKIESRFNRICQGLEESKRHNLGLGNSSMLTEHRAQLERLILEVAEMGRGKK